MPDDDREWRIRELIALAEAEAATRQAQEQMAEARRRVEAEMAASIQQEEERFARAQRQFDETIAAERRQAEERVAEAQRALDAASGRVNRRAEEERSRRLDVLRRRGVPDAEQVLARLEQEATAEAERERPLLAARAAREQTRIRLELEQRIRAIELLPAAGDRDEEIARARREAEIDCRVAEMRVDVDIGLRRGEILETKLLQA